MRRPRITTPRLIAAPGIILVAILAIAMLTAPAPAGGAAAPGPTYIAQQQPSASIMIVAEDGAERIITDGNPHFDVDRIGPDRILTSYEPTERCDDPLDGGDCSYTGALIYADNGTVLWEARINVRDHFNSEIHDTEYLPHRGEVLIADMEYERLVAVDVTTNRVTWTWDASEFYEPPPDPTRVDWLHINDVDVIGTNPDRYLISVRNANQLLIIERGRGVIEVINKDRDYRVMNQQHNPQWLGGGHVLVADSNNNRVVELARQPDGRWRPVWALYRADGQALDWPRDADRLPNGNTLIADTRNGRVLEVTETGHVVWSHPTGTSLYEADRNGTEYPAGPHYGDGGATMGTESDPGIRQPFGVVSTAYAGIHYAVGVPHWTNEWHVLGGLLWLFWAIGIAGVRVGSRFGERVRHYYDRQRSDPRSDDYP